MFDFTPLVKITNLVNLTEYQSKVDSNYYKKDKLS